LNITEILLAGFDLIYCV